MQNVLNEDTDDVIDSLQKTISSMLYTLSPSTIQKSSLYTISQVRHKVIIRAGCSTLFTEESSDCILIVSEVIVRAELTETKEDVATFVYSSIFLSMNDDSFLQDLNKEIVVEVNYVQDGQIIFPEARKGSRDIGPSRTEGFIAILGIGSFILCVPCLLLVVGFSRAREMNDVGAGEDELEDDNENYNSNEDVALVEADDIQQMDTKCGSDCVNHEFQDEIRKDEEKMTEEDEENQRTISLYTCCEPKGEIKQDNDDIQKIPNAPIAIENHEVKESDEIETGYSLNNDTKDVVDLEEEKGPLCGSNEENMEGEEEEGGKVDNIELPKLLEEGEQKQLKSSLFESNVITPLKESREESQ